MSDGGGREPVSLHSPPRMKEPRPFQGLPPLPTPLHLPSKMRKEVANSVWSRGNPNNGRWRPGSRSRPLTPTGRALKVLQLHLPSAHLLESGQKAEQQGGYQAEDPGIGHPCLGATELPCVRRGGERRGRNLSHSSPPMGPASGWGRSLCTGMGRTWSSQEEGKGR